MDQENADIFVGAVFVTRIAAPRRHGEARRAAAIQ